MVEIFILPFCISAIDNEAGKFKKTENRTFRPAPLIFAIKYVRNLGILFNIRHIVGLTFAAKRATSFGAMLSGSNDMITLRNRRTFVLAQPFNNCLANIISRRRLPT